MLLADAPLTLREFMTHEELPLASIFRELFVFLRDRDDAVLFGAHAVNAYCEPARMTEDVDIMSTHAIELAEAVRGAFAEKLHIAVRVCEAAGGAGLRVYQVRKPKNRHLVDVRQVERLPPFGRVEGIAVVEPAELVTLKAIAAADRATQEKGLSDRLDLARLLRTFPALRVEDGDVAGRLRARGASHRTLELWREMALSPLLDGGGDDPAEHE